MYHLVCGHCGQTNRLSVDRFKDDPKCGRCKNSLLPAQPVNLDDQVWRKMTAKSDLPVLVDFWAPWCGPCKMMAPEFAAAARDYHPSTSASNKAGDYILFAKLNTEEFPHISAEIGIRGIPTVILYKQGRELARQSGAMNRAMLKSWISVNRPA